MGASMWDQVWLPLSIGVATQIIVAALCFLSVRLWNCLMKQIKTQTAVGESAQDQPLPDGDAVAHINAVPDLETGNGYGPAEGGESMTEHELELGIVSGGEGMDYFSDQEAYTPVIKFPVTTPKAKVTGDAARQALVPVEMDVLHSQQEEVSSWPCRNVSCGQGSIPLSVSSISGCSMKRQLREVVDVGHDCYTAPEALHGSTSIIFLLTGEVVADSAPLQSG